MKKLVSYLRAHPKAFFIYSCLGFLGCLLILALINEKNWRPLKGKPQWEASSNFDSSLAGAAIDRNLGTSWAPPVSMGFGMYFQIDMRIPSQINGIVLHGNPRNPVHPEYWVIKTSLDGENWQTIVPQKSFPYRSMMAILFMPTQARYVQIILASDAAARWELYELELLQPIVPWQYERSRFVFWILSVILVLATGLLMFSLSKFSQTPATFILFGILYLALLAGWLLRLHDLSAYELSAAEWQQFDFSDLGRYTSLEWITGFFQHTSGISWLALLLSRWAYHVCLDYVVAMRIVPVVFSICTVFLVFIIWPLFFNGRQPPDALALQGALWQRVMACGLITVTGYPIWLSRSSDLAVCSVFFSLLYLAITYHFLYRKGRYLWVPVLLIVLAVGFSIDPMLQYLPPGVVIFGGIQLIVQRIRATKHSIEKHQLLRYGIFLFTTMLLYGYGFVSQKIILEFSPSFSTASWLLLFRELWQALRISGFSGIAFWILGGCVSVGVIYLLINKRHAAWFLLIQGGLLAFNVTVFSSPNRSSSHILFGVFLALFLLSNGLQQIITFVCSQSIVRKPSHLPNTDPIPKTASIAMIVVFIVVLIHFGVFSVNTLFIGSSAYPYDTGVHEVYRQEKRIETLIQHVATDTDECKSIGLTDKRFEDVYQTFYKIPAYYVPISELYRVSEFNRFWKYLFISHLEEFPVPETMNSFLERHYTPIESSAHTILYQLRPGIENRPQRYQADHLVFMTGYKTSDPDLSGATIIRATLEDAPGILAATPASRTCEWGDYTAEFVIRAPDAGGNKTIAALEIVADRHTSLERMELTGDLFQENGGYQTFKLPFTLDASSVNPAFQIKRIQCIVHFTGVTEVRLAEIGLIPDM